MAAGVRERGAVRWRPFLLLVLLARGSPGPGGPDRIPRSWLVIAALGGVLLALVNAAVALPLAAAATGDAPPYREMARSYGMTFHPDPLRDPGVLRVLITGLTAFPLYAG